MRRLAAGLLMLLAAMALLAAIAVAVKRPHTPPILGADGRVLPGSVASLEQVELGGQKQWILIRGRDRSRPVLLFLHGGPGMPAMYLAHAFQRPLEGDFVVVQWDRRGAGKSFTDCLTPDDLSVSRLLSDTEELVDILRHRFEVRRVYLVGHSFGSRLGLLFAKLHPDMLHAYVGVGQVVDERAARVIQERFIRSRALATGRLEAIEQIETRGEAAYETWLFRFGGELHGATSWWPLLWIGLRAPEYSLADVARVPRGSSCSSRHMKYDVVEGALADSVTEVDVPVYFFTGRYDFTTPYELVEDYFERLRAPYKELVWFEDSAHFPFLEQPEAFAREMRRVAAQTRRDPTSRASAARDRGSARQRSQGIPSRDDLLAPGLWRPCPTSMSLHAAPAEPIRPDWGGDRSPGSAG